MQETLVQSLGWEDLLGNGVANHSSTLAWRISWTEEPGGLQAMGLQKSLSNSATKHQQKQLSFYYCKPIYIYIKFFVDKISEACLLVSETTFFLISMV